MQNKQVLNVLRAKEASAYLGIGESTFWRWVKENKIPKGKSLSKRVTVWKVADLDRVLNGGEAEND